MKIKSILLTGDDGYDSIGTKLLIYLLKDKYDLKIAATRDHMSGVGGHIDFAVGGKFWIKEVDGVEAFVVNKMPVDSIEAAQAYFNKKFDLIISGVNWSENVGPTLVSSGTFSAVVRGIGIDLADSGIAMSWRIPKELKHIDPNDADLEMFKKFPGEMILRTLDYVLSNELWDAEILNINFPTTDSKKYKFTKLLTHLERYYKYPIKLNYEDGRFEYNRDLDIEETDKDFDAIAVDNGFISITPCDRNYMDEELFQKLTGK